MYTSALSAPLWHVWMLTELEWNWKYLFFILYFLSLSTSLPLHLPLALSRSLSFSLSIPLYLSPPPSLYLPLYLSTSLYRPLLEPRPQTDRCGRLRLDTVDDLFNILQLRKRRRERKIAVPRKEPEPEILVRHFLCSVYDLPSSMSP